MTMPPPAVLVTSLETADHVHQTGARTEALVLTVEPKRVAQALCWLVLGIVIVGTIANVVIYNVAPSLEHPLAKLMMRFDLGHEPSIPAWYSSIALLASSVLLAAVALASRRRHAPYVRHWAGLALIFLGLAVDEVVMFHEGLGRPITERFDTHGILYLPWVIPGCRFSFSRSQRPTPDFSSTSHHARGGCSWRRARSSWAAPSAWSSPRPR